LILATLADATAAIRFEDLGLHPIALELGPIKIRWYSLAYISGILFAWWYCIKLLAQPGAPMARRHADDFVFYATLGVILGGRLGYALFYQQSLLTNPFELAKLWQGGMSFHGGFIGVILAGIWMVKRNDLSPWRFGDYIACCVPFGMFFGRMANFVNGELFGRETTVPWGMIFPDGGEVVRHPSQLYEAGLEGLLLALILIYAFWKTDARYFPGRLLGIFTMGMGLGRFLVETLREPDPGVYGLFGMTMGQTLCIPMILVGAWFVWSSKARRIRVEPVGGPSSVA